MTSQSTPDTEKAGEPREFASVLLDMNKGRSNRDLTAALAQLVADVQNTGRAGKLTYTITVRRQKGDDRMVVLEDDVVVKPPAPERGVSFFFTDDAHGLHRNDPRQHDLFS